ncbi:FAD-dependent oxidoreductase [Kiritimatiellota bacterium B12222]|nr:FAD-dependent oxidoreductase [Kiritimatiellota bacterium B12222]
MSESPSIQIIGHGLAGAILAETLSVAGLTLSVFDDGGRASSQVAAGMFTPLTGQRMIASWALDEALPEVQQFYPALEKSSGGSFFHPQSTLRIFRSQKEADEWHSRGDQRFTQSIDASAFPFHLPFGACEITGGGWVNLPPMLEALKKRRQEQGQWGKRDQADITLWAEGVRASENPLWKDVGWRNAQGDILTLHIPGLAEDRIYNFGKFLVPLGNQRFRCGATYAWDEPSPEPREAGRTEIETSLSEILQLPFEVCDHQSGLRPVAIARVPVAGPHPEQSDQWIFNGFGSKGVLLAPWMAERMRAYIQTGTPLPKECIAARRIQRQRDREKTRRIKHR